MLNLGLLNDTLKSMIRDLSNKIQNIALLPQFDAFFKGAQNLSSKLDYYTTAVDGKLPELSEEDFAQICNILTTLSSEKQNFDLNVYRYYNNMNYYPNYYQRYWRTLEQFYKPYHSCFGLMTFEPHKTLNQLFEKAEQLFVANLSISVSGINMAAVKAGKKISLQITKNINGKNVKVDGFFQMDKKFVIKNELKEIINEVADKYNDFKEFYDSLNDSFTFNKLAEELKELPSCFDVISKRLNINQLANVVKKTNLPDKLKEYIITNISKDNQDFIISLYDFSRRIDKLNKKFDINVNKIGITETESLTQRSSAVSTVADLIGASEVIPNASNLTVKNGDVTFTGVFEEKAKGIELGEISNSDEIRNFEEDQFITPEAMKSISKLQVLDYITGNVNRESKKLFLEFDYSDPKKPMLKNVQGISNKYSFACNEVKPTESIGNMPSLAALKVIDIETATSILALTKSQLTAHLMDFNLSEGALEQAWKRCENLQRVIFINNYYDKEKGLSQNDYDRLKQLELKGEDNIDQIKLNIISNDEDWKNIKITDLTNSKEPEKNYFEMLYNIPKLVKKPRELNQELQKDSFVQGHILNHEFNKTSHEFIPYLDKVIKADKTFFKSGSKCGDIIKTIKDEFTELKNPIELDSNNETEFVAQMDIKLISIQTKIAQFRYSIDRDNASSKDKERLKALEDLDKFIVNKMNTLNLKYGDKHETEMKIEEDVRRCSYTPIESRIDFQNDLRKNVVNLKIHDNTIDITERKDKILETDLQITLKNQLMPNNVPTESKIATINKNDKAIKDLDKKEVDPNQKELMDKVKQLSGPRDPEKKLNK